MPTIRNRTSILLSDDAKLLKESLAEKMGISQSAVIEAAIRDMARKEGLLMNIRTFLCNANNEIIQDDSCMKQEPVLK